MPFLNTLSQIWSCRDWDPTSSLEENVKRSLPGFMEFSKHQDSLALDGFLFEIQGNCDTVEEFGEQVRRLMCVVSDLDPGLSKVIIMIKAYLPLFRF